MRGEASGPEIDGGGGQRGFVGEESCDDVVGAPPEEEEGAEEEGGGEAVVEAAEPVCAYLLGVVSQSVSRGCHGGDLSTVQGQRTIFLVQSMGPL